MHSTSSSRLVQRASRPAAATNGRDFVLLPSYLPLDFPTPCTTPPGKLKTKTPALSLAWDSGSGNTLTIQTAPILDQVQPTAAKCAGGADAEVTIQPNAKKNSKKGVTVTFVDKATWQYTSPTPVPKAGPVVIYFSVVASCGAGGPSDSASGKLTMTLTADACSACVTGCNDTNPSERGLWVVLAARRTAVQQLMWFRPVERGGWEGGLMLSPDPKA